MAWYCLRCNKEIPGLEVDVGNVGPAFFGIGPYHRTCLGPVRATNDVGAEIAANMSNRIKRMQKDESRDVH